MQNPVNQTKDKPMLMALCKGFILNKILSMAYKTPNNGTTVNKSKPNKIKYDSVVLVNKNALNAGKVHDATPIPVINAKQPGISKLTKNINKITIPTLTAISIKRSKPVFTSGLYFEKASLNSFSTVFDTFL